ncbi:MAG: glycosyltransferase [Candidatus Marinimicrobia bacterium]|nr:glycosyltransferase [candidate division WOR-3 bacterium]MCK4445838.1 glycosyltransferase [Candidatus Neomarinimicrobiota bacterium]
MDKIILMLLDNAFISDNRVEREILTLVGSGYKVELICWDRDKKFDKTETKYDVKLRITRIGPFAKRGKGVLYLLFKYLLLNIGLIRIGIRKEFDVIHSHNVGTILAGRIIKFIKKKPLIYDAHEVLGLLNQRLFTGADKIIHNAERILAKTANVVVVPTPGMISLFKKRGYVNELLCLENFPSKSDFTNQKRYINRQNGIIVGRIGTINKVINTELMTKAIKRLREQDYDLRLIFAGPIASNYDREFLNIISDNSDFVEYWGVIDSKGVPNVYKKIDISFNIPGAIEDYLYGYPSKLFEAMATGIPTVHSNIGESKSIIDKARCGLIIKDYSCESIINAFKSLLNDKEMIAIMGMNGYQAFLQEFNWGKVSKKLLDKYYVLLQNESRR